MSFPVPGGGGGGLVPGAFAGVQTIVAGSNISVSPASGQGNVTINASGDLGVSSLNTLTGDVTLEAGSGISISPDGQDLYISADVTSIVAGTGVTISPTTGLGAVTINADVTSIVAGTGVTISPTSGLGAVTINADVSGSVTSIIAGDGIDISPANGLGNVTINNSTPTYVGFILSTGQLSAGSGVLLPGQSVYMNLSITNPFFYYITGNSTKNLYIDFKVPLYTASGSCDVDIGVAVNDSTVPTTLTSMGVVSGGSTTVITSVHIMPCSEITSGIPYLYIVNTSPILSVFVSHFAGNHLALVY